MGAAISTAGAAEFAAELACCACSSFCGFLCKDKATRAKLHYCSFLLIASITCFVLLIPGMRHNLDRVPNFCGKLIKNETCDKLVGFGAVYRILISMTIFYGLLAILNFKVSRTDSFRAKINNGFWLIKALLILAITISTFFIPKRTDFFKVWMYVSLTGGFMFTLFQIMLIIDFGHSWSVSWAEKLETSHTKLWYLAMALATAVMFALSIAGFFCFYFFFTSPPNFIKCKANLFCITFVLIQCFLAIVVSITPTVQQEMAGAGLLQSSVIVLYAVYLTWNTLSSEPDSNCNPLGHVIFDYEKLSGINGEAAFGTVLTFALIIFACTVRSHTSQLGKYGLAISESEEYAIAMFFAEHNNTKTAKESSEKGVSLDEFVGYNYSLFHIILTFASLHILMIITNWHSPDQSLNMRVLVKNWSAVWVQMASSFVCILIYLWFLVTPLVRKMWGPLFGIQPEDSRHGYRPISTKMLSCDDKYSRKIEGKAQFTTGELNQPVITKEISRIDSERLSKEPSSNIQLELSGENHFKKLRDSVNKNMESGIGSAEDIEQPGGSSETKANYNSRKIPTSPAGNSPKNFKLNRHLSMSMESLRSGLSAISSATNCMKQRIKRRAVRRLKTNKSKLEQSMYSNVIDYRTANDPREDRGPKSDVSQLKYEDTIQEERTANESGSKNISASNEGRTLGLNQPQNPNDIHQSPEQLSKCQRSITPTHKLTKTVDHMSKPTESPDQSSKAPKSPDRTSSIVPSVFKSKPQDSQTAREILKYQWKILRMQAKVVKIQERIIRIQAESEVIDKIDMPLPVGQSSVVEFGKQKVAPQINMPFGQSSVVEFGKQKVAPPINLPLGQSSIVEFGKPKLEHKENVAFGKSSVIYSDQQEFRQGEGSDKENG